MKTSAIKICVFILIASQYSVAQVPLDYVSALRDTLTTLSDRSDNEFFQLHCQSIINVIDSKPDLTPDEISYIERAYEAFNNFQQTDGNPRDLSSYLNRIHPFILAWESPIDGVTSLSIFKPPKDWDPSRKYPVYVQLHGMWDVAYNKINYMTWPFSQEPSSSYAFEDGYYLAPWGFRAEYTSELGVANIWESIDFLSQYVEIDTTQRFICGHSAGGYGAKYIASRNIDKWAGVGIHGSGFDFASLGEEKLNELLNLPIYFVVGTNDGAAYFKETCFDFLYDRGHRKIKFVSFEGGHEYRQEDVERMYLWMRLQGAFISSQEPLILTKNLVSYPNPFQHTTQISYTLPTSQKIKIEIFNYLGQPVSLLVNKLQPADKFTENWTPENLPSGVYYLRLSVKDHTMTKKLIYRK